jgi:hypothetical protein
LWYILWNNLTVIIFIYAIHFRLIPQPISLMGAPRPGYRAASNNLRMAGRGDFGEYISISKITYHILTT